MAGQQRAKPEGMEWVARQLRDLQRQVDQLRSAAGVRNATISGGDGLTVKDGGRLRVIDPDGTVLLELGALPDQPVRGDGKPQVGWIIRRDSGELAGYCLTNVVGGVQSWSWTDRAGHGVLADDAFSSFGLASPYVPLVFGPAQTGDWLATTAGTFTALVRADFSQQHPTYWATFQAWADTSGTTGQVRVMLDGVQIGSTVSISNSVVTLDTQGGAAASNVWHGARVLTVEARRTAGTGQIRLSVSGIEGRQS